MQSYKKKHISKFTSFEDNLPKQFPPPPCTLHIFLILNPWPSLKNSALNLHPFYFPVFLLLPRILSLHMTKIFLTSNTSVHVTYIYAVWMSVLTVERLHCKRRTPICRLFFKIDLLTDIAALCLTGNTFTQWLVFSTQLVSCCPHGRRNYTCVLLPLYLLSDLLPPFPN
jgi:hypothetical protein